MKIVDIQQGSPEWHAYRREHFNASDAAAMLGISPYKKRGELLREYATGLSKEHDAETEARFARGHELEDLARRNTEEALGEELFPAVGEYDEWPKISASFDGITMDGETVFEAKTLNNEIREAAKAGKILAYHRAQMEQQLLVSGAQRCIYVATDGTDEIRLDYKQDPKMRASILFGWRQFGKDLAEWQPETDAPEEVAGQAPELLPALRIELVGRVAASNLPEFKAQALALIGNIKTDLTTDQDFADAEKTVKWCKEAETRLAAAKEAALSQTADIDALFKAIDGISESLRTKRLSLEKSVKSRKEAIKADLVMGAAAKYAEYLDGVNREIAHTGFNVQVPQPDFQGAIRGLKTFDSTRDALDTAIANGKMAVDASARDLIMKHEWFRRQFEDFAPVFPDLPALARYEFGHFTATIELRVAKEKERREAEKARIEAEQRPAQTPPPAPPAETHAGEKPAELAPPTLKLGEIQRRIGFNVSAEFLKQLGFNSTTERSAKLYHEDEFPPMCNAIAQHVISVGKEYENCS